jgi:hypothetical protein
MDVRGSVYKKTPADDCAMRQSVGAQTADGSATRREQYARRRSSRFVLDARRQTSQPLEFRGLPGRETMSQPQFGLHVHPKSA